jgi:hypothetical protein
MAQNSADNKMMNPDRYENKEAEIKAILEKSGVKKYMAKRVIYTPDAHGFVAMELANREIKKLIAETEDPDEKQALRRTIITTQINRQVLPGGYREKEEKKDANGRVIGVVYKGPVIGGVELTANQARALGRQVVPWPGDEEAHEFYLDAENPERHNP